MQSSDNPKQASENPENANYPAAQPELPAGDAQDTVADQSGFLNKIISERRPSEPLPDSGRLPSKYFRIYNPLEESPQVREAIFVDRDKIFDKILSAVIKKNTNKHQLIVGNYGSGKTMLMARIGDEISAKHYDDFFPLNLPEEQHYTVCRPSDALINWLEVLKVSISEGKGKFTAAERVEDTNLIDQVLQELINGFHDGTIGEESAREIIVGFLKQWCKSHKKKLVICIDNFDKNIEAMGNMAGAFLKLMQEEKFFTIIAATPDSHSITNDARSVFDATHSLPSLKVEEFKQLLVNLSNDAGRQDVIEQLEERPGMVHALHFMAEGNPRMAVIFHKCLMENPRAELKYIIEKALDSCTSYYKVILGRYLEGRKVGALFSNMELGGRPLMMSELSDMRRIEVGSIGGMITHLKNNGLIRESMEFAHEPKALYEVADNLIYSVGLMRNRKRDYKGNWEHFLRTMEFVEALHDKDVAQLPEVDHLRLADFAIKGRNCDKSLEHVAAYIQEIEENKHNAEQCKEKAGRLTRWIVGNVQAFKESEKVGELLNQLDKSAVCKDRMCPLVEAIRAVYTEDRSNFTRIMRYDRQAALELYELFDRGRNVSAHRS